MQHGCCVGSNVKWSWSHTSSEYNEHPWSTCGVKEIIHSDQEILESLGEKETHWCQKQVLHCMCTRHSSDRAQVLQNRSSSEMEADIILDGFLKAGQTHGVRYTKFIGDGKGSVFPILCNKWCQYGVGAKITNFRAGGSNLTVVRPFLKKGCLGALPRKIFAFWYYLKGTYRKLPSNRPYQITTHPLFWPKSLAEGSLQP